MARCTFSRPIFPDQAKQNWVSRVLGVDQPRVGTGGKRPSLLPIWIEAKEDVDAAITKLQDALREFDDAALQQIAEFGLYGATEGENVALMAALRDADGGDETALKRVTAAVTDYQAFLEGAVIVDLVENNPFGVKVPLRQRLGAALSELERLAA